jgi:redox-sensitive bicupin YhaK (pirin superfamily)
MITIRKSADRGHTNIDWLDSRHSFSFGDYFDPQHMGFGPLRVINDDRVAPGGGFGAHPHRDMEIITYIVSGALEHKDSLGTGSVIRPGDVQRMTAGSGIRHSEFNPSQTEPVHFLQIWIEPNQKNLTPSYEQRTLTAAQRLGSLRLIASSTGRNDSVTIHQDTDVYASLLEPGQAVSHQIPAGHSAWLQLIRGAITLNGKQLAAGDSAAIKQEQLLEITAQDKTELLLFDLRAA